VTVATVESDAAGAVAPHGVTLFHRWRLMEELAVRGPPGGRPPGPLGVPDSHARPGNVSMVEEARALSIRSTWNPAWGKGRRSEHVDGVRAPAVTVRCRSVGCMRPTPACKVLARSGCEAALAS
jgi:hypothetical protein